MAPTFTPNGLLLGSGSKVEVAISCRLHSTPWWKNEADSWQNAAAGLYARRIAGRPGDFSRYHRGGVLAAGLFPETLPDRVAIAGFVSGSQVRVGSDRARCQRRRLSATDLFSIRLSIFVCQRSVCLEPRLHSNFVSDRHQWGRHVHYPG